jgi:hypothetical protein
MIVLPVSSSRGPNWLGAVRTESIRTEIAAAPSGTKADRPVAGPITVPSKMKLDRPISPSKSLGGSAAETNDTMHTTKTAATRLAQATRSDDMAVSPRF